MNIRDRDRTVHILFKISVIGKAIDGVLEVIGGVILFFVSPNQINVLLRRVTQHELSEDPHDLLAGLLVRSLQHVSSDTEVFAAFFLLWHGVVKVGLVVGLLRKYLWVYPNRRIRSVPGIPNLPLLAHRLGLASGAFHPRRTGDLSHGSRV
jgi:uncharacterized membrane protein